MKLIPEQKVAQMLGVHQRTIQRWVKSGQFVKRIRIGPRKVYYQERDVLRWIEKQGETDVGKGGSG